MRALQGRHSFSRLSRRTTVIGASIVALIASGAIVAVPVMSQAATAIPAVPNNPRVIATPAGTEVRFQEPSDVKLKPTGYQAIACGPFAIGSGALTQARLTACASAGKAITTNNVNAKTFVINSPCKSTSTSLCVIVLRTVSGIAASKPTTLSAGGVAPTGVTSLQPSPGNDGRSVMLTWAAGQQQQQSDGSTLTPTYEVYRGSTLIAENLSATSYNDTSCGLAVKCTYSVAAVTPSGRVSSAAITATTTGTAAPKLTKPATTVVPPKTTLTGTVGHGIADARDVSVTFTPVAGGTPTIVQAVRKVAAFSVVVPTLAPGYYDVVAAQSGRQDKPMRLPIAATPPLKVTVGDATGSPVPVVPQFQVTIDGTGTAAPIGPAVTIEDRVLAATVKITKIPTAAEIAKLFNSAAKGQKVTVAANANGAWSTIIDASAARDRIHIVAAAQISPDGKAQTVYAVYSVPKATRPASPKSVIVTTSSRTIAVSWQAPGDDGGSPITAYRVTTTPTSAGCTTTALGCSIGDLANGVAYTVSLTAVNALGSSTAVTAGPVMPRGVPTAPTHVTAKATSRQVTVTWQAPDEDGGAPITDYTVTMQPTGRTCATKAADAKPTECVFASLADGTAYTFSVVAINVTGLSPAATATATPIGPPQPPVMASASPGDRTIVIVWEAPISNGGAAITGYTATATPGGRSCTTAATARTCTIEGLSNGTNYTVVVTASNANGTSDASAPLPARPVRNDVSIPSAPRAVTMTPQESSLVVTWQEPADLGGGVTEYRVVISPGGQSCTTDGTETSCTITGIDKYAIYSAQVTAANSAGTSGAAKSAKASFCALEPYGGGCYNGWGQYRAPSEVRAVKTDQGIEISFDAVDPGPMSSVLYYTVTAAPSGEMCVASQSFDWGNGGPPSRPSCIITGTVAPGETFRVTTIGMYGGESSPSVPVSILPPATVTLEIPRYISATSLTLVGQAVSVSSFWVVLMPSSCDSIYSCVNTKYFAGELDANGNATVTLTGLTEDTYQVLLGWQPLSGDSSSSTSGPSMKVDITAPTAPVFSAGSISETTIKGTLIYESELAVTLEYFTAGNASESPDGVIVCSFSTNGTFSCPLANLPDGAYRFRVVVRDGAGNSSVLSQSVTLDTKAPAVVVRVPAAGAPAAAGVVTVAGTAATTTGDGTTVAIVARFGASVVAETVTIVDGAYSAQLMLSPGVWTITVTRTDAAGNRTVITRVMTVEAAAGKVTITLPGGGDTVNLRTTLIGTAPAGANVEVSVDGNPAATVIADQNGGWRATVVLSAASHTLGAAVAGGEVLVAVVAAANGPTLSIAGMGAGGRTSSTRLCGTSAAGASVAVTWGAGSRQATADADGVWCVSIAALADGDYDFTATAAAATANRTISIDRTAPTLTVTSPSGLATNSRRITVASPSQTADASTVTVEFYPGREAVGEPDAVSSAKVVGGGAALVMPNEVTEGEWTIVVTRRDSSGNIGRVVTTFVFDTTAPALTHNIVTDMTGPLTIEGQAGTADGDAVPVLAIDGNDYPVTIGTDGAFRVLTTLRDGTHVVTLTQFDSAGNNAMSSVRVTVDSVAPLLSWAVKNGDAVSTLQFSGSAGGNDGSVSVTAIPERAGLPTLMSTVESVGGLFSVNLSGQAELRSLGGWWNVTASRRDLAGNTTVVQARVFLDPVAAPVTLTGTAAVVASSSVTISGTAQTVAWLDAEVTITVTGKSGTAYTGKAPVADGVFRVTITLPDGTYTVTVSRSAPLNPVSMSMQVQVDTVAPVLTVDASAVARNSLCGTTAGAVGDSGSVLVAFGQAGSENIVSTTLQGTRFCASPPRSGSWSASVTQTDAAGHTTTTAVAARAYDIDAPTPSIVETSPPVPPTWWSAYWEGPPTSLDYGVPQWHAYLSGTGEAADGDENAVTVRLTKTNCASDCTVDLRVNLAADRSWKVSLADVPAGTWQISWVEQRDSAGNAGRFEPATSAPDRYWLIVDHTAPPTPTYSKTDGLRVCYNGASHTYDSVVRAYRGDSISGTPAAVGTFVFYDYPRVRNWCQTTSPIWMPFAEPSGYYYDESRQMRWLPNGKYTVVAVVFDETGATSYSEQVKITIDRQNPVVTVSGFTTNESDTAMAEVSIVDRPVLHGRAAYDEVTDKFVVIDITPTGDGAYDTWARNRTSTVTHHLTIPVESDGTWTWQVPSNFPSGHFSARITQSTKNAAGAVSYDFFFSSSVPTIESAVIQKRWTDPSGLQYNTIYLSGTLPAGRTGGYGRVTIEAPWLPEQRTTCSAFTVTGNTWTCNYYGPTAFSGYGANSGYRDTTYTFRVKMTYSVGFDSYQWYDNSWVPVSGGQELSSTFTIFLKATVPSPVINSPAKPDQYRPVPIVKGAFTITGAASTSLSDNPFVTAEVYSGRGVTGTPAQSVQVDAAADGSFSKSFTLADGTWSIRVCQSDSLGLRGCSDFTSLTIDNTGPAISVVWPASAGARIPFGYAGGTLTGGYGDGTGFYSYLNDDYSVGWVEFFRGNDTSTDAVIRTRVTAGAGGNYGWGTRAELAEGNWTMRITATDGAGNITVATRTFVVDATATASLTPSFRIHGPYGMLYNGAQLVAGSTRFTVAADSSIASRATPALTGAFTLLDGSTPWASGSFDSNGVAVLTVLLNRRATPYDLKVRYDGDALYRANTAGLLELNAVGGTPKVSIRPVFPRGGGLGGWILLYAEYDRPGWGFTTCKTGQASVYDSDGALIAQGPLNLLTSYGLAMGSVPQGGRNVSVVISGDAECADTTATTYMKVDASTSGPAVVSAPIDPAPYVGNPLTMTVTVPGGDWSVGWNYWSVDWGVGWLGVPVWRLDDNGNKIGAPVYTDRMGTVRLQWTPTRSGNISVNFLAGGAGTGFAESRVTLVVPVEESAITMAWSFNPGSTHPGEPTRSTLAIGGAGNNGTVKVSSTLAPNTSTNAAVACAATCTAGTDLPTALLDSGTGDIIGTFTSAATGRVFTAQATVPRTPWPTSVTLSSSSTATVTRDTVVPVVARVTFPSTMPSRLRTGSVVLTSLPSPDCATGFWGVSTDYCGNTRFEVRVNVQTLATTLVRGVADRTATTTANWEGDTLVISSGLFVGGTTFNLYAGFAPADATVATGSGAVPLTRIGTGGPAISVAVATAVITGGMLSPPGMPLTNRAAQKVQSWTTWGERNPRVGETAFVKVQFDPALATPADRSSYFALAMSHPGADPVFVDAWNYSTTIVTKRLSDKWNLASWDSDMWENSEIYANAYQMPRCTDCVVWGITNLETSWRDRSGGLTVGDRTLGVVGYQDMWWSEPSGSQAELDHRRGITAFHLTVEPMTGTQRSSVSVSASKLNVVTAARWSGLPAGTQAEQAAVSVTVRLTPAGGATPVDLVQCYYAGFCLDKNFSGGTYNTVEIMPTGAQLSLSIDLTADQVSAVSAGATITVITEAPWSLPVASDPMTPRLQGLAGDDAARVTVNGTWLGANLETPDLSSPWGILPWSFYENTKMFWESVFGAGAAANFFISLTGILAQIAVDYLLQGGPFGPLAALGGVVKAAMGVVKSTLFAGGKAFGQWSRKLMGANRILTTTIKTQGTFTKVFSKATGALSKVASRFGGSIATALNVGCKVSPKIRDATVPIQLQRDDELFKASNCVVLAFKAAAEDMKDDPDVALGDAYQQAMDERIARLARENTPPKTNVGLGEGIAIQFTQSFSAVVSMTLPGFDSLSAADKAKGKVTIDTYSDPGGGGRFLGTLAWCTFDGNCSSMEGISAKPSAAGISLAGVFPRTISWTPSGAWLRVTVHMPDGTTKYSATGDIAFAGKRYDCWQVWYDGGRTDDQAHFCHDIDSAERFYGATWDGKSTGGWDRRRKWPTEFNAFLELPHDWALLTAGLP